jgi:hypothetical protein
MALKALVQEELERYNELLDEARAELGLSPMSEVQGGRRTGKEEVSLIRYRDCDWCGGAVVHSRMAIHKLDQCPNREED